MLVSEKYESLEEIYRFIKEEIKPFSFTIEEQDFFSKKLIKQLGEKKILGAPFPEEFGGLSMNALEYGQLTEEIGKACCATRTLLTVHTSLIGETVLRWGTETQKRHLLPLIASGDRIGAFALSEPLIGSNARGVQTEYRKEGSNYIINGLKKWISFAGIADFFLVVASCDGRATAFLVDRKSKGVIVKPMKGLLAGRGTHIAEIQLIDVQVNEDQILGREGTGFAYIVNTALDYGRFSVAWGGLGIAQTAVEAMIKYAKSRRQFGAPIGSYQLIQEMIAESVADVRSCRALCESVSTTRNKNGADAIHETIVAKYFSSKVANKVAATAVQLHGANGLSNEFPVERLFREARVLEIIEGTTQILQQLIAEEELKKY
jgi:alkylation response protein AidB-like acyl-CoA dehydrogenase